MRVAVFALPLLFCAATPAYATGGFFCQTGGAKPIEVNLVISHAAGAGLVEANLTEDGVAVPTEKAQWWIDGSEIRVILVDPNAEREEVVIKARGRSSAMTGTLQRGGRSYRVRCEESG
jgi:hypothetical protein